jgi:hypothetical protein
MMIKRYNHATRSLFWRACLAMPYTLGFWCFSIIVAIAWYGTSLAQAPQSASNNASSNTAPRAPDKYRLLTIQEYPYPLKNVAATPDSRESETWENVGKNILTSFSLPLSDLLNPQAPTDGFSVGAMAQYPLRGLVSTLTRSTNGADTQGERGTSPSLGATVSYSPLSYWFISATFFYYLNPNVRAPWDPDFAYRFGYDDWHPYTFSLVYWSVAGNRFNTAENRGRITHFDEGTWSFGFKFPAPPFLDSLVSLHSSSSLAHVLNLNITPRYQTNAGGDDEFWKTSLSLGTKYTVYGNWYVNLTLYYYPFPHQQQPWDPDFTYGLGYFDWRSGTISVQYNNFAGNRYPWRHDRDRSRPFTDVLDGGLMISISLTL